MVSSAHISLITFAALLASSCSVDNKTSELAGSPISPCQIRGVISAGKAHRVALRGLLTVQSHGFLLSDANCPGVLVGLDVAAGGPDLSLCSSATLSARFGCPAGGYKGPVVTVVGELSEQNGIPRLVVVELKDFADVPPEGGA